MWGRSMGYEGGDDRKVASVSQSDPKDLTEQTPSRIRNFLSVFPYDYCNPLVLRDFPPKKSLQNLPYGKLCYQDSEKMVSL